MSGCYVSHFKHCPGWTGTAQTLQLSVWNISERWNQVLLSCGTTYSWRKPTTLSTFAATIFCGFLQGLYVELISPCALVGEYSYCKSVQILYTF